MRHTLTKILEFRRPGAAVDDTEPKSDGPRKPPRGPRLVTIPSPPPPPRKSVTELGDELRTTGREFGVLTNALSESDLERIHVEKLAIAKVDDLYRPFDPDRDRDDRRLVEEVERLRARQPELRENVTRHQKYRDKLALELGPAPGMHRVSAVVVSGAILVYAAGFGLSVEPLLAEKIADEVLSFVVSFAIGAAMGAMIVFAVLGLEEGDN